MKLFYKEDREVFLIDINTNWQRNYVREYFLLGMLIHRRIKLEPWEE